MIKKLLTLTFGILSFTFTLNAATHNVIPNGDNQGFIGLPTKNWATINVVSGSVVNIINIGSATVYGTITSSSGFAGDGSKLTGINASSVQSLPLIAADTGYMSIYASQTITGLPTFASTITARAVAVATGALGSPSFSFSGSSITGFYYDPVSNVFNITKSVGGSHGVPLDMISIQSNNTQIVDNSNVIIAGNPLGPPQFIIKGRGVATAPSLAFDNNDGLFEAASDGVCFGINQSTPICFTPTNNTFFNPISHSSWTLFSATSTFTTAVKVGSVTVSGTITSTSGYIVGNSTISGNLFITGKVVKRVVTVSDATSITPNIDTSDYVYQSNTQAAGTLTLNAPTGSPSDGQPFGLRIKCTNAQTFSWDSIYRDPTGIALPTATTGGGNTNYYGLVYNLTDNKWDLTGSK